MKSKNVTLSLETDLLEAGRRYAKARGTSLNAMIRSFLKGMVYGGEDSAADRDLMAALDAAAGNSGGKRWSREDAYRR